MRLLLDGLDFADRGSWERALSQYEQSLRVDPTNPYAYLVLAHYSIELGDASGALSHLDQSKRLLSLLSYQPPGVQAHLEGLRGMAFRMQGKRREALSLLEAARRRSPQVWGDGRLDARELW